MGPALFHQPSPVATRKDKFQMTSTSIQKKQARENTVYETAKQIRDLLDKARESYGTEAFDEGDIESTILELVTSEDES